ncbi:HAD family hydrolase [Jongsikchunia kroppenstedtii]|uniref:HAD family hydrolase n=1 Tax=Jongsikchunia kroppenstedtii TaxID=1121721 RepID=UPI0005BC063C|nr:HAD family hydrolase [Jongsikchunia kroppenstedtii]
MSDPQLSHGLRAVVFDVGETLVDESRMWAGRAAAAGVTPFALMGVLGALIERGEDHRRAWEILGVSQPPAPTCIGPDDLYPDALECLHAAKAAGFIVGIAGNQPADTAEQLLALGFKADVIASSAEWGVSKPSETYFAKLIDALGVQPHEIMYVGDRVDNDIVPAHSVGLRTAFIRRGPWGLIHAGQPEVCIADLQFDSLSELTAALRHR